MRKTGLLVLVMALGLVAAPSALAKSSSGVRTTTYKAGPYQVRPGANLILVDKKPVPHPNDAYIVSMKPNLRYAKAGGKCCGAVPRVDVVHLHHGVWLSDGKAGKGYGPGLGGIYPFFAAGEEKTTLAQPPGYGYPVGKSDHWIFNYMIHDLTPAPAKVWVTYTVKYIPFSDPAAKHIKPTVPIWMDVEKGSIYPVFDVHRHSGRNGKYTFPLQAKNPYPGRKRPLNQFRVKVDGTLVGTGGHLHPGGLWDQLDVTRPGVTPKYGTKGKGVLHGLTPNSVRLFRSNAHYFDPRGPISWDLSMGVTNKDWKPKVKKGDVLSINTTYDTTRASWYESMGIMVTYFAPGDTSGRDPFTRSIDQGSHLTHGHLAENRHHGGTPLLNVRPSTWKACHTRTVDIKNFVYRPGDLTATGKAKCAPTVKQGGSITFDNQDASPLGPAAPGTNPYVSFINPSKDYLNSIFHTITSCKSPCGLDTGISYPLANGAGNYDSAQLGVGTPASGSLTWKTPAGLKPGTYTYFCRIHPFMRGTFRIVRR